MVNRSFILRVVFLPKTVKIKRRWEQLVAISPTPFKFFQHEKTNAMERQRSFLFFSCDKSQEVNLPDDGSDDLMKLMQEPHETLTFTSSTDRTFTTIDELHKFWNEQTKLSAQKRGNDDPSAKPPGPDGRNECDCSYRIIDITVPEHDPSSEDTQLSFSGPSCTAVFGPKTFNRDHWATGTCTPFPNGATPLPNLNPDPFDLIPFNCGSMPRYWNLGFPINFSYLEYIGNCNNINSVSTANNEVSLTFQIICSDVVANPDLPNDCDDVQDGINGHSFASPIVKMIISATDFDVNTPDFFLGGCGCEPMFN
jgi:hypothetical protein